MINPSIVNKFSELLVNASASNAPIMDSGIENNTTNGYTKLLYKQPYQVYQYDGGQ